MRKTVVLLSALTLGTLAGPAAAGDMYFGAKTGPVMVDGPDPTNASVMLGYELGVIAGDLGVEGELGTTIDEASNGAEVDTAAAYLAFRTAGPLYLIAKGGAAYVDPSMGDSETNSSYGLGLGFSIGLLQLEAEFTRIHDDADYLTLGVRF